MNENDRSGDRWQPGAQDTQPVQSNDPQAPGPPAPAPRRGWRDWGRNRSARPWMLGIVAATLLLVIGAGGFAIGRFAGHDGFGRGFDEHRGAGTGQVQGQPQGYDHDGDDDHGYPPSTGGTQSQQGSGTVQGDTTAYVVRSRT